MKRRIANFLGNTLYADEFAHTILHSEPHLIKPADPALKAGERQAHAAPSSAADRPRSSASAGSAGSGARAPAKSRYGGRDITSPSAKYGVPLVRRSKSRAAAVYGQKPTAVPKVGGGRAAAASRYAAAPRREARAASPLKVAAQGIRPRGPADDRVQAFKAMEQKKVRRGA